MIKQTFGHLRECSAWSIIRISSNISRAILQQVEIKKISAPGMPRIEFQGLFWPFAPCFILWSTNLFLACRRAGSFLYTFIEIQRMQHPNSTSCVSSAAELHVISWWWFNRGVFVRTFSDCIYHVEYPWKLLFRQTKPHRQAITQNLHSSSG